MSESRENGGSRWWYLLLIIQFVGVLWVPFYNSVEPSWSGIPFFYWYQLLWVVVTSILLGIVVIATRRPDDV